MGSDRQAEVKLGIFGSGAPLNVEDRSRHYTCMGHEAYLRIRLPGDEAARLWLWKAGASRCAYRDASGAGTPTRPRGYDECPLRPHPVQFTPVPMSAAVIVRRQLTWGPA